MSQAVYDEKVTEVLSLLADGKTKDEISAFYNQEWKTIYVYMSRKGFHWDSGQETFVEKIAQQDTVQASPFVENTKAAQVIRMFDVKHPDIKKIAIKQGFQSVEELGDYMKSQGYRWSDEITNYVEDIERVRTNLIASSQDTVRANMDEHLLIQFLLQHQEKLKELLTSRNDSHIVTYKFKGTKGQKTLALASGAIVLIEDYSKEFNMTQRAVVETALGEFFERHGYQERLKAVTL